MSKTSKKMLGLELEFVDQSTHGFIKWVDQLTGDTLAILGLGSTGIDKEGIPTDGDKFIEWDISSLDYLKITGKGFSVNSGFATKIDGKRDATIFTGGEESTQSGSYTLSEINMDFDDYSSMVRANILIPYVEPIGGIEQSQSDEYLTSEALKAQYNNSNNGLIIKHENAIVFANPITNRLLGEIDVQNEAFSWYGTFSLGGEPVTNSSFEIKRTDSKKSNITLNADIDNIPELGFKENSTITWNINSNNGLNIKNPNNNGITITDLDVVFSGEIKYKNQNLDDRYYQKYEVYNKTEAYNKTEVYNKTEAYNKTEVYNKTEAYNKTEVYNKEETYNKNEVFNKTEINGRSAGLVKNITSILDIPLSGEIGELLLFDGLLPTLYIFTTIGWKLVELA